MVKVMSILSFHIQPQLHSHTVDNPQGCLIIQNDQIYFIPVIKTANIFFSTISTFAWLI